MYNLFSGLYQAKKLGWASYFIFLPHIVFEIQLSEQAVSKNRLHISEQGTTQQQKSENTSLFSPYTTSAIKPMLCTLRIDSSREGIGEPGKLGPSILHMSVSSDHKEKSAKRYDYALSRTCANTDITAVPAGSRTSAALSGPRGSAGSRPWGRATGRNVWTCGRSRWDHRERVRVTLFWLLSLNRKIYS